MKKKIISVLLIASMICAYGFSVAAESKRGILNASEVELAAKVLSELEIMEYSVNNEQDIISGIDFAVYLGRLLGVDEQAQSDITYYTEIAIPVMLEDKTVGVLIFGQMLKNSIKQIAGAMTVCSRNRNGVTKT